MSHTLSEIAQQLSSPRVTNKTITTQTTNIPATEIEETKPVPKVQLIYAFNGTGKTRLSREFKQLIAPKMETEEEETGPWLAREKILYYNAFTEDLFYWDNDLENDSEPKLRIQPNTFTDWIINEQGQDQKIIANFQKFTNDKLTPRFNEEYITTDKDGREITVKANSEVTFSMQRGDDRDNDNLKISKGEESHFVWSVFFTMLAQVISVLNVPEPTDRETNDFDQLEYVFIDDPVSSLDENHLIELAVNLGSLIKSSLSKVKFIVTTHNTLFYNVLYNELSNKTCYLLERYEDETFTLVEKKGDSNKSFSYHLFLKQTIEKAIVENQIQKYHYTLLRNLYEKTSNFLGYKEWKELLPNEKQTYYNRIIQFTSHSTLSNEAVAEPSLQEKQTVALLLKHLLANYGFFLEETQNG